MTEHTVCVPASLLEGRVFQYLCEAGASTVSARAATQALMHASLMGVDSHGARLAVHYATMLRGGRINPTPNLTLTQTSSAVTLMNADNGLGHYAGYQAMEKACEQALQAGVGVCSVAHSTHFGAAGAYALHAASQNMIGIALSNSDANVALHGSTVPFHGTNPLAAAAPVQDGLPWFFDTATSSIPFNRVRLYRSLDKLLPPDVAATQNGQVTRNPHDAFMLLPLGGESYGFKGAGLAGLITILSAALSGATLDADMIPMTDTEDHKTYRNVGHFFMAINPEKFLGASHFKHIMKTYLASLSVCPSTTPGVPVLYPGEREWQIRDARLNQGIILDQQTYSTLFS